MNKNNLTAIVTGGAKGIGKAISTKLAAKGFDVIAADYDEEAGKEFMAGFNDPRLTFYKVNISDEESVKGLFDHAEKKFGCPFLVVNNAGIIRDNVIWKMSVEEFDTVINNPFTLSSSLILTL